MTGVLVMPISGLMASESTSRAGHRGNACGAERIVDVRAGRRADVARCDVEETALPEHAAGARGAGVDGVERIVLGGGQHDVVQPGRAGGRVRPGGNGHARIDQRLGVHLAVEGRGEQLRKRRGVDGGRRQDGLSGVESAAGDIVVVSRHAHRERQSRFQDSKTRRGCLAWKRWPPFVPLWRLREVLYMGRSPDERKCVAGKLAGDRRSSEGRFAPNKTPPANYSDAAARSQVAAVQRPMARRPMRPRRRAGRG